MFSDNEFDGCDGYKPADRHAAEIFPCTLTRMHHGRNACSALYLTRAVATHTVNNTAKKTSAKRALNRQRAATATQTIRSRSPYGTLSRLGDSRKRKLPVRRSNRSAVCDGLRSNLQRASHSILPLKKAGTFVSSALQLSFLKTPPRLAERTRRESPTCSRATRNPAGCDHGPRRRRAS